MDPAKAELVRAGIYARWQPPPPEELTEDKLERRRLAEGMRRVIEVLIATGAPLDELRAAADELARIADRFEAGPLQQGYEGYRETANVGGDVLVGFDLSPFIGPANPLAPPISLRQEGERVVGSVRFGSAYEGPPGCVHGGYVAATFDELLGATQSMSGHPGMTGTLTVRYRAPTPLHTELRLAGWLARVEGRKIFAEGTLHAGDRLCAEAEGIFISIDAEVFRQLMVLRDELKAGGTPTGE